MKPLYILTSAIVTDAGIFDPWSRLIQTHATIDSIYKHHPEAIVILVEGGKQILHDQPLWQQLRSRCHAFIDQTNNKQIAHLHEAFMSKLPNRSEMGGIAGVSKTVAEMYLLRASFVELRDNKDMAALLKGVDRIFKISGRYCLSPLYDASVYDAPNMKGKYIFKERDASWMTDAKEALGIEHGYNSRFWSFDVTQLDDAIDKLTTMIDSCMEITQNHYIDIEHLLFKHIGPDNSVEIDHTHLFGSIAPTGSVIYD
jgi:hypothetical protein